MISCGIAGKLPDRGFVRQEQIELAGFLANRFGAAYATSRDGVEPIDGSGRSCRAAGGRS